MTGTVRTGARGHDEEADNMSEDEARKTTIRSADAERGRRAAVMPFGKFAGLTVALVYERQPSYLAWFYENRGRVRGGQGGDQGAGRHRGAPGDVPAATAAFAEAFESRAAGGRAADGTVLGTEDRQDVHGSVQRGVTRTGSTGQARTARSVERYLLAMFPCPLKLEEASSSHPFHGKDRQISSGPIM